MLIFIPRLGAKLWTPAREGITERLLLYCNSLPFLTRLLEMFEALFIMDFGRRLCKQRTLFCTLIDYMVVLE